MEIEIKDFILIYIIAYLIDLIIGDPNYFFHPIRLIGKLVIFLEKYLYKLKNKKIAGGLLNILVITIVFIISKWISEKSIILKILLLYTTLATKCLADEGKKIHQILKEENIEKAKKELSYLVSRDTNHMDERQIIRSGIETISENSVDGVLAPMFYAFLGSFFNINNHDLSLPFAMCYKAINTMDSMVGYKNEKYIDFGMISAKIDDYVNFIPARIGGLLIIPTSALILGKNFKNSVKIFLRDRKNHNSPNSGCPEAAFAGALDLQFGGNTSYFGKIYNKPTIGDKIKEFSKEEIPHTIRLLYVSSLVGILLFITFSTFIKNMMK